MSHDVDYEIIGDDMQLVEIELDGGETVIAEAGAMAYMDAGISYEAVMGDGSRAGESFFQKAMGAGKRLLTGESLFMTHFTNAAGGKRRVAFAAPYPGRIVPLELAELGGHFTCQKDAFLCAAMGTAIDITFTKRFGAGLFGGEGFILQRISGDGRAFLHAGGTVIRRQLTGGELFVDTGCIVGFTDGIEYDIAKAGNLRSMVFGGEGLFLAHLKGSGTVYLQSLPFSRLAARIAHQFPPTAGAKGGEGSPIGKLGNLFGDR